jgi:hypothetical protein
MRQYYSNIAPIFPDPVIYNPDFGYFDKMLQRKEDQYNKGFQQVSKMWQYVSRPVTNEYNAQVRDAFLKQAKENLKNISSLDLSEYQNVESALNVFAPYYKNTNLIMDQELTEFYDQQEGIAESYKNQDGGKYFNEVNLADVRSQREDFAKAKPEDWKYFYNNKRSYKPYYNTTDERIKAMEKFKPSSVTTINKNGAYITTITDKSWYKEDISRYLEGVLSAPAKEQFALEARQAFRNNPNALVGAYIKQSESRLPAIDKELKEIDIRMLKAKTDEERQQLQANKDYFKKLKTSISESVTNLKKGDKGYVNQKFEELAKSVYIDQIIDQTADSYQHQDIDRKLDYDEWVMLQARENGANYRARLAQEGADRRALWALSAKDKKEGEEEGEAPDVSVPTYENEDDAIKPKTVSQLQSEAFQAEKEAESKKAEIVSYLRNAKGVKEVTDYAIRSFLASNPNSDMVKEYGTALSIAKSKRDKIKNFEFQADEYARNQMGDANYKSLRTWQEAKNVGVEEQLKVEWDPVKKTYLQKDASGKVIADKGKFYYDKHMGQSQADIDKRMADVAGVIKAKGATGIGNGLQLQQAYDQYRNQYLNTPNSTLVQGKGKAYSEKVVTFKEKKAEISAVANINPDDIVTISAIPSVKRGVDLQIKLKTSKENPLDETRFKAIKADIETRNPGSKVLTYNEDNGTVFVTGLGSKLKSFDDINLYKNIHPAFSDQIENLVEFKGPPNSRYIADFPALDKSGRNVVFQIMKIIPESLNGDPSYILLNPKNGTSIKDEMYKNITIPYIAMVNLLQLPSDELDNILENAALRTKLK